MIDLNREEVLEVHLSWVEINKFSHENSSLPKQTAFDKVFLYENESI